MPNTMVASLDAPVTVANIGGSIDDRQTDLDLELMLDPGRYLVTVDGAFVADGEPNFGGANVWPQLSLFIDHNDSGQFECDWDGTECAAGEGDISPNVLMPEVADRHASVSGTNVIELDEPTRVGVVAFGYTSTTGSEGSGQISVFDARLIVTPVQQP